MFATRIFEAFFLCVLFSLVSFFFLIILTTIMMMKNYIRISLDGNESIFLWLGLLTILLFVY